MGFRLDLKRAKRHPHTGAIVSSKQELKWDARALYREEQGHDPSPRQLKRWIRQKNIKAPLIDLASMDSAANRAAAAWGTALRAIGAELEGERPDGGEAA